MNRKILLVVPPFYRLYKDSYSMNTFPFALSYLAGSILLNTKWNVKVYNADFNSSSQRINLNYMANKGHDNYIQNVNSISFPIWQEIKRKISEFNPDIIGLSTVSSNFISACNIALLAKECNPNVKVIFGGPYPTMAKKEIMANKNIDFTVVGEGENTIVELLKYFEGLTKLDSISGIIFRKNGDLVETTPRELMKDLDHLPFPVEIAPKVLFDFNKYPLNAFKNILAARGCPYDCVFCASKELWTKLVRTRSVSNVRKEIELLMRLGVKRFQFIDDTFGAKKKYYNELCDQLKQYCSGMRWTCLTRADLINKNSLLTMKDAGCEIIQIGVESGNNEILRKMNKSITVEQTLEACKLVKKFNIELQTFFLVGFPYETEQTLQDTVKMMKDCKSDSVIYSIFTPYPHTQLFDFCEKKGLINKNLHPTLFNHQSPENCFSLHINPIRFRKLASKIEKMIERQNMWKRFKSLLTGNGVLKLFDFTSLKLRMIINQLFTNEQI